MTEGTQPEAGMGSARAVRVKVCGLTRADQARHAARAGADFVGLVLWSGSPRAVGDRGLARALCDATRAEGAHPVGVFVDEEPGRVLELADELGLAVAQLHGNEPESTVRSLAESGLQVWKALRMGPTTEPTLPNRWASFCGAGAGAVLLDAWHPTLAGGTGQKADWQIAASLAGQGPLVLAGGLDPDNVGQAIRTVRPWGVDVSSSLEHAPGDKDPQRVETFVRAVRNATNPEVSR